MTLAQTIMAQAKPRDVDEATFQRAVVEVAREAGWIVHETPNEAVSAAAARGRWDMVRGSGFPDLVLARPEPGYPVCFVELKTERGRLSDAQKNWHAMLDPGEPLRDYVQVVVWRPRHWPMIVASLRVGTPPTRQRRA